MRLTPIIIALLAVLITNQPSAAQSIYSPTASTLDEAKANYNTCVVQLQAASNEYSKCAGRLIERGVLPSSFANFAAEYWSFGAYLADLPSNLDEANAVVKACNETRAYVYVHRAACYAGL